MVYYIFISYSILCISYITFLVIYMLGPFQMSVQMTIPRIQFVCAHTPIVYAIVTSCVPRTPPYFTVSFSDNGIWKGKKYFHCKDGHGLIVPFNAVCRCSVASKRPPLSGNVLVGNPRNPRIPCV